MSYPTGPEYGTPPTGLAPYGYPTRPVRGLRRTLTIAVATLGIVNHWPLAPESSKPERLITRSAAWTAR
jgi:hypothetical protein